jgi:NAD(P)-dependent dehydrogenase (short-subunit alcohol dehydrogenase family)
MVQDGTNVVITGGAGGLGSGAARHFLMAGARVVLADVDEAALARTAAQLAQPKRVHTVRCDIASAAECHALVDAAEAFFGGPLDVFLANAGVPFAGALVDAAPEDIRRVIEVNVTGSILSAQAALRSLVRGRHPSLLFTGSLQSVTGRAGRSVYTASKHALAGLVKALALELGPQGVRVNGIAPTVVDTPFLHQAWADAGVADTGAALRAAAAGLPLGRMPTTDDFGALAVFLASPAAAAITGQMVMVDGGASAGKFY